MRKLALCSAFAALLACGPTQPSTVGPDTEPTATGTSSAPPVDTSDPFAVTDTLREEQLPLLKGPAPTLGEAALAASPKGLNPPPQSCEAYVKRAPKKKPACADKASSLAALDAALATGDPAQQDELLAAAESCTGIEPGLVRALRIELGPHECGDVLADPVLKAKPAGMTGAVQHTLVGQGLAARLTRLVGPPPKMTGPFDKKKVLDFTQKTLFPWFDEQRKAVVDLSAQGRELSGYGKGLVALASGWAYLRLVEVVRDAPIPDEFKKDKEVAEAYYGSIEERLDPTKQNGRDGALVGLGMMAQAGVIQDERMRKTRALLATMYGGRKVDALDALALPKIPDPQGATVEHRLAAKLPSFFSGLLLDPKTATDPKMLQSLLHRGVPMPMRAALKEADASLSPETKALYARARFEMAVRYWRAVDVDAAVGLLAKTPKDKLDPKDRLLLASALSLRNGPEDVAVLMVKVEGFNPKFADVRALDVVAKEAPPAGLAGLAAYDAAVLRQIAAPRSADAAYWDALSERYRDAASKLENASLKHEADERAKFASQNAKVIKNAPP